MTKQETLDLLTVMQAAYPNFYKGMNRQQADAVVDLWATMFVEEPFQLVAMAVKAHIASDTKGFPPHIGAIKEAIGKLMQPDTMTEQEAWALVSKAASNAKYEAEKEFSKLPPLAQKLVGSPNSLRAWALMDADTVSSVVASNFQRSYRAEVAKQKELLSLPSDVREGMQMIATQNRSLLEEGKNGN